MTDRRPAPRVPATDVVVTGMGVVTPIGSTVDTFWRAMLAGTSGVRRIRRFDATGYSTTIAAEVDDEDYVPTVPRRLARRLDRFAIMALAAAGQALEQSELLRCQPDPSRVGVCLGTSSGPLGASYAAHVALHEGGGRELRRRFPYAATSTAVSSAAGEIALAHDLRGPSLTVSGECASGANAIGIAAAMIRAGQADAVVCGGADATVTETSLASLSMLGALSTRNDEPTAACRPFDRDRAGFVLGEGSGVLILESAEHARSRGAQVLAQVLGYGAATDTTHATAPDPDGRGAVAAIRAALADAELDPEAVDLVNAHATGTRLNDEIELGALDTVFADRPRPLPVYGIKPLTGHMIAAAGAVEAIAIALSLARGVVPATRNCDTPVPTPLDLVRGASRSQTARIGLTTSFGFGGQCAALLLGSPHEPLVPEKATAPA